MKVTLIVVPPGGGRREFNLDFDLPALPRVGEYITLARDEQLAEPQRSAAGDLELYECFYVRQTWWDLRHPSTATKSKPDDIGSASMIAVEVEPARGPHMTAGHRRSCEAYEAQGLPVRTFDQWQ